MVGSFGVNLSPKELVLILGESIGVKACHTMSAIETGNCPSHLSEYYKDKLNYVTKVYNDLKESFPDIISVNFNNQSISDFEVERINMSDFEED